MLGLQQAWVIVDITCKLLLHLLCMILLHLSTVNIFKTILCRKLVIAVLFLFTESKYQIWRNVLFSVSSWVVSTVSGFGLSLFSEFFGWWDCCLAFSSLGFFLLLWPWIWLSFYTACVRREHPLYRRVLIKFSLCLSKKKKNQIWRMSSFVMLNQTLIPQQPYILDFSIAHPFSVVKNLIAKVRIDPFGLHDDI